MKVRIVTDSTCDLPDELIKQYRIEVAHTYINVGEISYIDGVDLSREQFYERIATFSQHPSTAAVSPGIFSEIYEKLAQEGVQEILSIHISSKLSAFCNHARLGANSADSVAVHVVDSQTVSMGLGLLVMLAARAAEAGQSAEQIVAMLAERIPRTRVYAGVDTLEYLRRGGRISWGKASLGTLLSIKPILEVKNGIAEPSVQVRTRKKILPKLLELIVPLLPLEMLAIIYSGDRESAEQLYSELSAYFPPGEPPLMTIIGPAVGVHTGPNVLGFASISR